MHDGVTELVSEKTKKFVEFDRPVKIGVDGTEIPIPGDPEKTEPVLEDIRERETRDGKNTNTPLFYPRQIPIEDGSDVTWYVENHAEVEEAIRKAKENGDGGGEAPVRLNYLVYNGYPFEVHKGANSVELYIEGARQDIDVGWNQELMSPRPKFNIEDVERKTTPMTRRSK